MSLKLKIKVGNITNLSDARYSAGMGVDWLGFRMDNIDPQTFREITGWVTGPRFVIEIHQPTDLDKAVDYTPDYLEIPVAYLSQFVPNQFALFVRLSLKEWNTYREILLQQKTRIHCLVLTAGTGQLNHDQDLISDASRDFEILIAYDVRPDTLEQWKNIQGFSLEGSQELKPGLKDYQALADILEQLEAD